MKRLTKRGPTGVPYYPACFEAPCDGIECRRQHCAFEQEACSKLCEYEDQQEQRDAIKAGLLRLGQTVWIIERDPEYGDSLCEDIVCELTLHWSAHNVITLWYGTINTSFHPTEIGKTVFTDKGMAERVLVYPEEGEHGV